MELKMILKAPWILPVSQAPIQNGAIRVEADIIQEIGPAQAILPRYGEELLGLNNTVLLPGLVNSHMHLGFRPVPFQRRFAEHFTNWIWAMIEGRSQVSVAEASVLIEAALRRMRQTGTTRAACHVDASLSTEWIASTPLRLHLFLELIGLKSEMARENLRKALYWKTLALIEAQPVSVSLTPHSLYSIESDLLRELMHKGEAPLSIHLLESQDEEDYLRQGLGELAKLVQKRGGSPLPTDKNLNPLHWLLGEMGPRLKPLVVHGNFLNAHELDLIQKSGLTLVHCPGSFDYFKHRRSVLSVIGDRNIPIALGTDSVASNDDLSMLTEMRRLKKREAHLSEETILKMATLNGAQALGTNAGCLSIGKDADIVGISLNNKDADPLKAVFEAEEVSFMMIGGKYVPLA